MPEAPASTEPPPSQEIIVPKEIAQSLGRALDQRFSSSFQQIQTNIEALSADPSLHEDIETIQDGCNRSQNVIERLMKAREVKIVPFQDGNNFEFSPDDEEIPLQPGVESMSDPMIERFVSALNHTLNNPLALTMGYAELMSITKTDAPTQQHASAILKEAQQIALALAQFNNAKTIEVTTEEAGRTTYTITPREKPVG